MQGPIVRIGIDLGDITTSAVAVCGIEVLAHTEVSTGSDAYGTIAGALKALLSESAVSSDSVGAVTVGGRRYSAAIEDRVDLRRVGVLRIGAPLTSALPPLVTWPRDLRKVISVGTAIIRGGCEFDGTRIAPLDETAIREFARSIAPHADAVAVTSVFSAVDFADEKRAAEILRDELDGIPISTSHEIGSMGLIERENATVLNATLSGVVGQDSVALHRAVRESGLQAECFFAQNDGTQLATSYATRFPILLVSSRPATGMRGAAFSSGLADAIVVEFDECRTTIRRLVGGRPWESLAPATISGVLTNLLLPEVVELGIRSKSPTDEPCLRISGGESDRTIAAAVDRLARGISDLPVLVVGEAGDSALDKMVGIPDVMLPPNHEMASALGAAVAPVGVSAERICDGHPDRLRESLKELTESAFGRAVQAGAHPGMVRVAAVDQIPLAYLRNPAVRIRVRVAGDPMVSRSQYVPQVDGQSSSSIGDAK